MTHHLTVLPIEYPTDVTRPKTRAECKDGPRPCPWVSCRHHLHIDVEPVGMNGRETMMVPHPLVEVEERAETCSLDLAEQHEELTLAQVASLLAVSRERIRQIEEKALRKLKSRGASRTILAAMIADGGFEPDEREHACEGVGGGGGGGIDFFGDDEEQPDAEAPLEGRMWHDEAHFVGIMWKHYKDRSLARPHPLEGLITVQPFDDASLSPQERHEARGLAVVVAYVQLANELGAKPRMIDVARRAKLRGDTSGSIAATTQQALRRAKAAGVELPFFNDEVMGVGSGPTSSVGRPASNGLSARNAAILETYCEIASQTGAKPDIHAVAARRRTTTQTAYNAIAAARRLGLEIPFDGERRTRPRKHPPKERKDPTMPRQLTELQQKVLDTYVRLAVEKNAKPSSGDVASAAGVTSAAQVCGILKRLRQLGKELPHYHARGEEVTDTNPQPPPPEQSTRHPGRRRGIRRAA